MIKFGCHSWSGRFRTTYLLLSLCCLAPGWQTNQRLIKANDPSQITDAVMIKDIAVGGKSVECGLFVKPPAEVQPVTPFLAGPDWLAQTTITLMNRTDKTIVSGTITLVFLDTGDCHAQPCVAPELHLGQIPRTAAYSGKTGEPLKSDHPERSALDWKPGATLTVKLSDYRDEIEASLSNHLPMTAASKLAVHIGPFFFESGLRWLGGYSVPDPTRPGKFRNLPDNYFPGNRAHNWPPGYNR